MGIIGHKTSKKMDKSVMKKIILFLLAIVMVSFVGCARRTAGNIPKISGDDYSTVYMFRKSKVLGFAEAYPIEINGVYLFRIGNGDCVTFKIPTGKSEVVCVPGWKRVRFLAEKGKKYYLYVSEYFGPEGPEFRQMTEEEWNQKQTACNWVKLK